MKAYINKVIKLHRYSFAAFIYILFDVFFLGGEYLAFCAQISDSGMFIEDSLNKALQLPHSHHLPIKSSPSLKFCCM